MAIVQALLDAGADLNAKDDVRPPRRRRAPAAARRRSLTRRVRYTAAPPARTATPPLSWLAWRTIRRLWRCWRRRSRGVARAGRRRAAALPLLAPPRLPRLAAAAPVGEGREPASGHGRRASKGSWTSSCTMRRTAATTRRPRSRGSWLRAPTPTGTRARCVAAPAPPRCRPPPRPPAPLPAARHSPPAPRRCRTSQGGLTALMLASLNGHTAIVQALLGAGADLNAKGDVRPPRCRFALAAARRRSLTRCVHRTAAPPGRVVSPHSTLPA